MADRNGEPGLGVSTWHRRVPLCGDASTRRYSRLFGPSGTTAVLVEYPKPIRRELIRDLEVNAWCRDRGLRVPAVRASDPDAGRVLLEDLGEIDAEGVLAATPAAAQRAFLEGLLGPLEVLSACPVQDLPPWNPALDRRRLRWELAGFELWYLRHLRDTPPWPALGRWLDELADDVASHPARVCHRDYHLNNLMPQPDGSVAVIDVQDLLVGPDTYDVVTLLGERSAVELVGEADRMAVLESWAVRTAAAAGWRRRAAAVRLQRGLKVLGTFARFTVAGRDAYREWLVELSRRLAEGLAKAGADRRLTALLLD